MSECVLKRKRVGVCVAALLSCSIKNQIQGFLPLGGQTILGKRITFMMVQQVSRTASSEGLTRKLS